MSNVRRIFPWLEQRDPEPITTDLVVENVVLKQRIAQLEAELEAVRKALKS